MKKIPSLKLILPLVFLFLALSCTHSHLDYKVTVSDEVSQLINNVPSAKSCPDAGIIYILDEKVEEVFEDGRSRYTLHTVLKVINDKGKDYANIKIGFNSLFETASIVYARTITPEGQVIPLKKEAIKTATPYEEYPAYNDFKTLTFSMPGVTLSSIIDYKVAIEVKRPIITRRFSSDFCFQSLNPILVSRYKLVTPKNMELKYLLLNPINNAQLSPRIIQKGDKKIYLWEYENIPQIIKEDSLPPLQEVAFRIMVTNMNSWGEFADWWRKLVEGKTESDRAIREKVTNLTKDLSTNGEKTETIFDYVKREIRYVSVDLGKSGYEPKSAIEVFENKYGDCKDKSTLLISMLKSAGIPAHYVLIPTNEIGNLLKYFPYPFQFDHCIVAIKNKEAYHFLDPVAEEYQFDYLPSGDQNRDILIFEDRQTIFSKTPLAKPEENTSYSHSRIKIGTDGSIQGEARNFASGDKESYLRWFYIDNGPTEIREELEKRIDRIFPGARLLEYSNSDPLEFKEKFVVNVKYYAPDYCKNVGDILIFELPEIRQSCTATGKRDRRYPLVSWTNSCNKKEVEFNIPEGYEIYYVPEPVETVNKYFEFRSSYRQRGDKIFYQGEFVKKAIRIPPEEYPAYQKFCQGIGKSFRKEVLFRKKDAR